MSLESDQVLGITPRRSGRPFGSGCAEWSLQDYLGGRGHSPQEDSRRLEAVQPLFDTIRAKISYEFAVGRQMAEQILPSQVQGDLIELGPLG